MIDDTRYCEIWIHHILKVLNWYHVIWMSRITNEEKEYYATPYKGFKAFPGSKTRHRVYLEVVKSEY